VCPEKVPEVEEVKVTKARRVPEPEASSKRPVPPVIVKVPTELKTPGVDVGHKEILAEVKTLSPFAPV